MSTEQEQSRSGQNCYLTDLGRGAIVWQFDVRFDGGLCMRSFRSDSEHVYLCATALNHFAGGRMYHTLSAPPPPFRLQPVY